MRVLAVVDMYCWERNMQNWGLVVLENCLWSQLARCEKRREEYGFFKPNAKNVEVDEHDRDV